MLNTRKATKQFIFTLDGVSYRQLLTFIRDDADGHTIFPVTIFKQMGFSDESIAAIAEKHVTQKGNPKGTIFQSGRILDSLFGVWSLSFIRAVCRQLKVDTAVNCMGRGFEARQLKERLLPVLQEKVDVLDLEKKKDAVLQKKSRIIIKAAKKAGIPVVQIPVVEVSEPDFKGMPSVKEPPTWDALAVELINELKNIYNPLS